MAVNKPTGDNARKGAVRKRSQIKIKTDGPNGVDQAQQERRSVHGRQKEHEEVQGCSSGESTQRALVGHTAAVATLFLYSFANRLFGYRTTAASRSRSTASSYVFAHTSASYLSL